MRYERIPKELFIKNRECFSERTLPFSISIFSSNGQMPTNADGIMGFVQSNAFFYLTGIDQEDSYLIISKTENETKEILFVKETNETLRIWEGEKLTLEESTQISGIKIVKYSESFWNTIERLVSDFQIIYLHFDEHIGKNIYFKSKEKVILEQLKERYPLHTFKRACEILNKQREIKSEFEIELIKKAINISKKGFLRAVKFLKPGKMEFEIEAELSHEFLLNRSRNHAFQPIMASGKNACVLHYISNNDTCKNGDLILMDFGAEYGNYKADMTRTIPINGKFTDRQREVYTSVLNVLNKVKTKMIVGNSFNNLKNQTHEILGKELIKLGLTTSENLSVDIIQKYFPHGISHFLGLDVHDVGSKNSIFEAGMVLTCEPGIYILEEGIGIRLENDILITENGNIDLMEDIPIEIYEIEELMRQD